MIGNATVVHIRPNPGGFDEYGDPVASTDTRTTIDGCAVAPRTTEDINDRGRAGVIVGLSLYAPYGTDVQNTDLFEIDGELFQVDGDGGDWKSPYTGWEAGVEVALKRAAG